MTAWCHLPTIFKQRRALQIAGLGMLCAAFITTLLFANVSHAVTSTTRTINFQGRLLTPAGAVVPDGNYNIQFKIYQGGSGTAAGNPDGTLDWTESHINNGGTSGVEVKAGFFSVSLGSLTPFGSSIDWNQSNLWLSMNVAGSATGCTSFGSGACVGDGEMLPMKQVTATPYAINAGAVGGKTADNFTQLGQGVQSDSSNNSSIFINKTGSGNAVQLQANGADMFTIDNAGSVSLGSATDHSISIAKSTTGNGTSLTIGAGGAAGSSSGTGGDLVLQGGAGDAGNYSGNVIVKANTYDSPNTFQVQNADNLAVLNVDTSGGTVTIQGTSIYHPNLVIQAAVGQSSSQMLEFRDSNGNRTADIGSDANQNLSFGVSAIGSSATGGNNIGFGTYAAGSLTSGYYNVALGGNSLSANQDGVDNIAIGQAAAGSNVSGSHNVAIGWQAYGVGTGSSNIAMGYSSLANSTTGYQNVALGQYAGYSNTTGNNNTYLGNAAGDCHWTGQFCTSPTIQGSTAVGYEAQVQANNSLVLGSVDDQVNVGIGTTVPLNILSVSPVDYSTGTASQSGNTITGTGTTWTASMVGDELVFSDGTHGVVTGFTDATHLTLGTSQTVADQAYRLHRAGLNVTSSGNVGIGTTNPQYLLDVVGTSHFGGTILADNGVAASNVDTTAVDGTLEIGTVNAQQINIGQNNSATWTQTNIAAGGGGINYYSGGDMINRLGGTFSVSTLSNNQILTVDTQTKDVGIDYFSTFTSNGKATVNNTLGVKTTNENAFSVQNTAGSSLFNVNTNGNAVQVGDGTAGGEATVLSLDQATSAPTTTSLGSMYYDTTVGKVQCYQANGWGSCAAAPNTFVTISPQYSGAVMNGTDIGTISSDFCSDPLNINDGSSGQPSVCGTNETYNFYKWTSSQTTAQTRSIFVTYQLPTNFKNFVAASTSLLGRTDSTNSTVTYQIYHSTGTTLTACGAAISVSTGAKATWQKATASGTADPSSCSFAGGDSILFRINLSANTNANAYVSDLKFVFSNN